MKKIVIAICCIAAFGMTLFSADSKRQKMVIGNGPLQVEINRQGYIIHALNGKAVFNLMLQVHWRYFAYQSKDLQIAMDGEDAFRSAGSFANIQFSSRTWVQSNRAETEYQLALTEDNPFSAKSQWEVTPFFSMERLKEMGNCNFSGICVSGKKFSGKIGKLVSFPGRVRSFTIHNVQGYDLTLEFPSGALGIDRRKEVKPQGLWFFVPAVMNDGSHPQKAGDRAVLRINTEVKETMEK